MTVSFDIDNMTKVSFVPQNENKDKGWSYSYVYYLRNLKDIYLLLCKHKGTTNIPKLLELCKSDNVQTENGKEWNTRYLLEFVNALKNFGLIDINNNPLKGEFFESEINAPLTSNDNKIFVDIYFSYFRFKELHNLFGSFSDIAQSSLVYAYMFNCRFYNRFVCADKNIVYCLENNHQDMMRFWDVYTKWGTTLHVLNKCSMSALDMSSSNEELKNAYLLNLSLPVPDDFSVLDFMKRELGTHYVYIPELERDLILRYRFSIESIKDKIVKETKMRSNEYRMQRTSEIFVDNNTKTLLPCVENAYMSHIIKL